MSHLNAWLLDKALPLWSTVGLDKVRGGFHEMISQSGEAVAANRRARVAGRQVYVYATAARSGLPGPWRAAAEHGLDFIVTRFLQPDGMMRCLLSPQGEPLEADLMLYDQAFCLFALAAAAGCGLDPDAQLERALRLRRGLETNWRIPDGGFIENDVHRYQANPHMHLLEASLAWEETAPGQGWEALADELAQFALETFIDPKGGFLREFFSPDWTPAPGKEPDPAIAAALAAVNLAEQASNVGELGPLEAAVAANPDDHQARFDLAVALSAKGERDAAADCLLEIIRRDRKWNDEAARKQLLQLFEAWGLMDPASVAARRKLSAIWF